MPSQSSYIFEGILILFIVLMSVKGIYYFSSNRFTQGESLQAVREQLTSHTPSTNAAGKKLFMQNCASCHGIRKELTAPALVSVDSRIPDRQLLFDWIRNNQKVLKSGNPYFNELYRTYNKIPMPAFPQLTDADIQSILDYIGEESNKGPIP